MKTTFALLAVLLALASPAAGQPRDGHIFVTDYRGYEVLEVDPTDWSFTVFADSTDGIFAPSGLGFTSSGKLLVCNYGSNNVMEFDASGNGTVVIDASDGLNGPWGENGIAIDSADQLYVASYLSQEILRFDSNYGNGIVFADSADGVVRPDGLGFTSGGDLMVANRGSFGQVLTIDPAGNTSVWDTIVGEDCLSLVVRNNGDVYVGCGGGNVYRYVGGDPNQRVLFGAWGAANISMAFSLDFSVLYHSNSFDGKLRAIDPDTGTDVVVVDAGWQSIAIAVAGSQFPPGSWARFGTGVAGAGGFMPTLKGQGDARLGATVTIETRDFVGGATSYFLLSTARLDTPAWAGTLYPSLAATHWIWPSLLPGVAGTPGAGDEDRVYAVPNDPLLSGTNLYFQQLARDTLASGGMAMTNGLRMYIGE